MKRGFTLIELLVVITIIGLLSGMILVSLGGIRAKARDVRRMSDIRQIVLAMELAYSDDDQYIRSLETPDIIQSGSRVYLDPVPRDLRPGNPKYSWRDNTIAALTNCDAQNFCIYVELEEEGYFAGSPKGTRELSSEPPLAAGQCCW
jgi:prepilin-type N-terminal cleavage/methylation domain-containing protein